MLSPPDDWMFSAAEISKRFRSQPHRHIRVALLARERTANGTNDLMGLLPVVLSAFSIRSEYIPDRIFKTRSKLSSM